MCVKQHDQVCHLQDFVDSRGHVAQFQIAARSSCAGQQPYQHSQSTAVDENHLAEVQHNAFAIRQEPADVLDRKSTRLNSSHSQISYAVFCLKKKKIILLIDHVS